jgi:putative NADPH-quinone reductase
MHVLVIFAHQNRRSFDRAVLQRFVQGLQAAGHEKKLGTTNYGSSAQDS